MFSINQKRQIADAVQRILRSTGHPELPEGEIQFHLHVEGAESWSWADIKNNGAVTEPGINPWNEAQAARPTPQPEPERPTDQELLELLPLFSYEDGLYDGFFQPGSLPSDWSDEDDYIASPKAILVFARAVLARFGVKNT